MGKNQMNINGRGILRIAEGACIFDGGNGKCLKMA